MSFNGCCLQTMNCEFYKSDIAMSNFNRRIDLSRLTVESLDRNQWFRELLARWLPAGQPPIKNKRGQVTSLRLAIRSDNQMTYYAGGQQIAKVKCSPALFRAIANLAFLQDQKPPKSIDVVVPPCPAGEEGPELDRRIQRSIGKQGRVVADSLVYGEKVFVEDLIGANEDVFDIEVGLGGGSSAPRLDMLSLEPSDLGWRIAVWEAKLARNGGGKSRSTPDTVVQHANYFGWFGRPDNIHAFIKGARNSCHALCHIHDLAGELGLDLPPLGAGIRAVGTQPDVPLSLDQVVRYVVDTRTDTSGAYTERDHAGNLRKLTKAHVQTVGPNDSLVLDRL